MTIWSKYFFGNWSNQDLPALKWWNTKRKDYNLRLLSCLLIGQFLVALTSLSLGATTSDNLLDRLTGMLLADLLILISVNILYFLWPVIETLLFKTSPNRYRKVCFAFLNTINMLILAGYILLMIAVKI